MSLRYGAIEMTIIILIKTNRKKRISNHSGLVHSTALLYNITPALHQTIIEKDQIAEAWRRERTAIYGATAGPGTKPA